MARTAAWTALSALALLTLAACGEPDATSRPGADEAASVTTTLTLPTATARLVPTSTPTPSPSPFPTSTPEGWIALPTQEQVGAEMDAEMYGLLVEEHGCLWVEPGYPGHTGGNFLIIWPLGYTAQDEHGQIVVRDAAGELVGRVGEEIYMGGGGAGRGSHGDDCTGQLWISGSTVRTGPPPTPHPSAMGTYPPLPAPEELGATTLEYLRPMYEERSGNPEVVLSRALTVEEVHELANRAPLRHTRIDPELCADGLRNENWYCHPGSTPALAVVRGDWWQSGVPSVHALYIGVLYDLNDHDPVPILLETILSCNGALFKPFLADPAIPDDEPPLGC